MDDSEPWKVPPGPVLRGLKAAARLEIGPEDFSEDEASERERFLRDAPAKRREHRKGKHRR